MSRTSLAAIGFLSAGQYARLATGKAVESLKTALKPEIDKAKTTAPNASTVTCRRDAELRRRPHCTRDGWACGAGLT